MKLKLGINGFGRIGRSVFRQLLDNENITIVGINDLTDISTLAHLLKYDSTHGVLDANVSVQESTLLVNKKNIQIFFLGNSRINRGIAINGNFIDPSNITIAVSIRKLVPVFKTIAIIVVTARPIAIGTFIDKRSRRTANIVRIIIKYLLFARHLLFEELNFYSLREFLKFQIK